MSADISFCWQKLPFRGARLIHRFLATGNGNRVLVAKLVAKVAWQLATATSTPKGVCLWLLVAVADSSNPAPRRFRLRVATAFRIRLWMAAVSRNGGIHPFAARRSPRRGRPARMPTGRARMCVRRRPWSADRRQARRNRLYAPRAWLRAAIPRQDARRVPAAFSRGMALCSRGRPLAPARRAESGANLVTTL